VRSRTPRGSNQYRQVRETSLTSRKLLVPTRNVKRSRILIYTDTRDNGRSRVDMKVIAGVVTAWMNATCERTNVTISCDIPVLCSLLGLDTLISGSCYLLNLPSSLFQISYTRLYPKQCKNYSFSMFNWRPKTKGRGSSSSTSDSGDSPTTMVCSSFSYPLDSH